MKIRLHANGCMCFCVSKCAGGRARLRQSDFGIIEQMRRKKNEQKKENEKKDDNQNRRKGNKSYPWHKYEHYSCLISIESIHFHIVCYRFDR